MLSSDCCVPAVVRVVSCERAQKPVQVRGREYLDGKYTRATRELAFKSESLR